MLYKGLWLWQALETGDTQDSIAFNLEYSSCLASQPTVTCGRTVLDRVALTVKERPPLFLAPYTRKNRQMLNCYCVRKNRSSRPEPTCAIHTCRVEYVVHRV